MTANCRHVARVTLELDTPFLVASGRNSDFSDAVPVLDSNGLPAIPGSSLGGLLRHAFRNAHGDDRTAAIFGAAPEKKTFRQDGRQPTGAAPAAWGSRLWITWAHLHDSTDEPVDGLRPEGLPADPVLDNARGFALRDHVKISHRGAAADTGKFDQAVVPAGNRFTFDMTLEGAAGDPHDEADFEWLLRFLASGRARLGGSTRRGLGAFRVVRCRWRRFDLGEPADARDYCELPVDLNHLAPQLVPFDPPPLDAEPGWRTLTLRLEAEDYWAFHGAEPWTLDGETEPPDFNPVREERIEWSDGQGQVALPRLFVPGSAVKGPIAHRVAFHHNLGRLRDRRFRGLESACDPEAHSGQNNPAVRELFGSLHEDSDMPSTAGRVFIDDVWLSEPHHDRLQRIDHTSIDRFTGGVRAGVLFEERVIYKEPLEVRIAVERFDELDEEIRAAFREACRDLAEGRLALGAGGGRGHGYFRSSEPFDELWNRFEGGD